MEAYKSTCHDCGEVYFWTGYKTGLGKTKIQLEQMSNRQKNCKFCGSKNLKTEIDCESDTGKMLDKQVDSIVDWMFDDSDHK